MASATLPAAPPPKTGCGPVRKSRMTRRRAAVLVLVHLVAGAHILHWYLKGSSVTPVEPSEAHEVLTYGVINAGLVLLLLSVLSTLVLGRWFCGWACHVVALQDLCAGLLGRLGVRPRPIRARLLAFVPLFAALDVFVLPRVLRWLDGQRFPGLSAEFTTSALWETFPGPWMAALTLLVDGFLVVYLLGAKGFCTYGCPYGALFGAADRYAKGRIRVTDACEGCGHCTATCTSNVDVRQEVARFGMVVDAGCMKCMDCVSVCPKHALYFGFGPVPERARGKPRRPRRQWDFSWPEELLMAAVFAGALYAFRGLYGAVPFLLAIGLSVCLALGAALLARLLARRELVFQHHLLKAGGRWTRAGAAAGVLLALALAFGGHSFFVQLHARLGERDLRLANAMAATPERATPAFRAAMESSRAHLRLVERFGLVQTAELHNQLGSLAAGLGDDSDAERHLRRAIALDDSFVNTRVRLAEVLITERRYEEATELLGEALARDPLNMLAGQRLAKIVADAPELVRARLLLIDLLIRQGNLDGARNGLAPLLQAAPDDPEVRARADALERARRGS